MTTVGIIGSGHIGSALARLAVDAGHRVLISNSRGPETLADLVAELGPRASAATSEEAAAAGKIVVITVPVKAFPDLPVAALAGRTVIDTCNYGAERDGPVPELDSNAITSSELLQRHLPGATVVKAFNTIYVEHLLALGRPSDAADRSSLPIAGDSASAKAAVTAFLDSLGYDVVDTGSLADGWRQATGTPAWGTPYGPYSDGKGRPAGEDVIRAALAAATRGGSTGTATPLASTSVLPGWGEGPVARAPWLEVGQVPVRLAPGASTQITVALTASVLTPAGGAYRAAVVLADDSPYPAPVVRVTMRVR